MRRKIYFAWKHLTGFRIRTKRYQPSSSTVLMRRTPEQERKIIEPGIKYQTSELFLKTKTV